MARTRATAAELENAVVEAVRAAGGSMTHNDLVEQLDAAGMSDAAKLILPLSQSGRILGNVKRQAEGGKPVLSYRLPEGTV